MQLKFTENYQFYAMKIMQIYVLEPVKSSESSTWA